MSKESEKDFQHFKIPILSPSGFTSQVIYHHFSNVATFLEEVQNASQRTRQSFRQHYYRFSAFQSPPTEPLGLPDPRFL